MTEQKYVVFTLGPERYALPIEAVERILNEMPVTPMPRSPKMFLGVFDLRGVTIPTLDMRRRLDMPERAEEGNFVVVDTGEGRAALRVDRVEGIQLAGEDHIEPISATLANDADPFASSILRDGDLLAVVLDPEHIIPAQHKKKLAVKQKEAA